MKKDKKCVIKKKVEKKSVCVSVCVWGGGGGCQCVHVGIVGVGVVRRQWGRGSRAICYIKQNDLNTNKLPKNQMMNYMHNSLHLKKI